MIYLKTKKVDVSGNIGEGDYAVMSSFKWIPKWI